MKFPVLHSRSLLVLLLVLNIKNYYKYNKEDMLSMQLNNFLHEFIQIKHKTLLEPSASLHPLPVNPPPWITTLLT